MADAIDRSGKPGAAGPARQDPRGRGVARREPYGPHSLNPFSMMRQMQDEMDRWFEGFGLGRAPIGSALARMGRNLESFGGGLEEMGFAPQVEIFRRGDELVVSADLPGLRKDEIKVDLEDDAITISGERRQEHAEEHDNFFSTERSYGSFRRVIPLPDGVDPESARARYRDGVLEITMKLTAPQKQRRQLSIEGGAESAREGGAPAVVGATGSVPETSGALESEPLERPERPHKSGR